MSRPLVVLVAAVARHGGIGRDGGLLARLPEDLRRFKRLTLGHPVVMGRRTWDSIGRPLPGRKNIVVTRQPDWRADGADTAASLDEAFALAGGADKVFVIGGAEIYALALPRADVLELTEIDAEPRADTFFPPWNRADFRQTARQSQTTPDGLPFAFATYERRKPGE